MKPICVKLFPLLLASLAACKTIPVTPHVMNCDVNKKLLTAKCSEPRLIASEATYASLIDTMQADRKSLQECGLTADALRDALQRCNQAITEYNKKIDALNASR